MTAVWDDTAYGEDLQLEPESEVEGTTVHGHGGRVRYGVNPTLEEAADQIIFDYLRGITSREEKSDVLTPWKEKHRLAKEIYNASGFPDSSIRQGMFGRVLNRARPHLNSRDGLARSAARSEHTIALKHFTGTDSGSTDG